MPVPGGPTSSTPLGMRAPSARYLLGVLQVVHDLDELGLRLVDAGDVGEGDRFLLARVVDLRLALPEAQRSARAFADALHEHPVNEAEHEHRRDPADEELLPPRARLDFSRESRLLFLELGEQGRLVDAWQSVGDDELGPVGFWGLCVFGPEGGDEGVCAQLDGFDAAFADEGEQVAIGELSWLEALEDRRLEGPHHEERDEQIEAREGDAPSADAVFFLGRGHSAWRMVASRHALPQAKKRTRSNPRQSSPNAPSRASSPNAG